MTTVNFGHAFDRWYQLTVGEHARVESEKKKGGVVLSWEALDHMCGLAVESGMKALMFKAGVVSPDASGDFPADTTGRRPHIHDLWSTFMAKTHHRTMSDWIARLAGGAATPPNVFQTWRTEHRYAADGSVPENVVSLRLAMAKRLKSIAQEVL